MGLKVKSGFAFGFLTKDRERNWQRDRQCSSSVNKKILFTIKKSDLEILEAAHLYEFLLSTSGVRWFRFFLHRAVLLCGCFEMRCLWIQREMWKESQWNRKCIPAPLWLSKQRRGFKWLKLTDMWGIWTWLALSVCFEFVDEHTLLFLSAFLRLCWDKRPTGRSRSEPTTLWRGCLWPIQRVSAVLLPSHLLKPSILML